MKLLIHVSSTGGTSGQLWEMKFGWCGDRPTYISSFGFVPPNYDGKAFFTGMIPNLNLFFRACVTSSPFFVSLDGAHVNRPFLYLQLEETVFPRELRHACL